MCENGSGHSSGLLSMALHLQLFATEPVDLVDNVLLAPATNLAAYKASRDDSKQLEYFQGHMLPWFCEEYVGSQDVVVQVPQV